MKRIMQRIFGQEPAADSTRTEAFLREEEQRQMDEVRERLQRVREELISLDRRRPSREASS